MSKSSRRGWGRFVALPENEAALLACRLVRKGLAEGPRPPFLVLYLHGESGIGKTTLVTHFVERVDGAVALTAWEYAKQDFAHDVTAPPLLVVEDVHHLPPDAAERLVAVLNARASRRLVTVVTAPVSPFDLKGLSRRLTTRLGGGLTVAIPPYGAASRLQLLRRHSQKNLWNLSDDTLAAVVAETVGGVRELLAATADRAATRRRYQPRTGKRAEADPTSKMRIPKPTIPPPRKPDRSPVAHLSLEELGPAVADAFGISADDLRGDSRHKNFVTARQAFAYVATEVLKRRVREIAAYLNRPPASFGNSREALRWKMVRDPATHAIVKKLESDWRAKARKMVARVSTEGDASSRDAAGE